MHAFRGGGLHWARAGTLVVVAGALGCIVETERPPRKPLLRDHMDTLAPPPVPSASHAGKVPLPPPVPDAFRVCETTADCVAVLPNGCCQDGRNEALNKTLVDSYRSTFSCPIRSPACPTQLVLDRRVAICDATSHTCKLVDAPP